MLNVLYILEAPRHNNIMPGLLPGWTRKDIEQPKAREKRPGDEVAIFTHAPEFPSNNNSDDNDDNNNDDDDDEEEADDDYDDDDDDDDNKLL